MSSLSATTAYKSSAYGVSSHDLRHTCASLAVSAGVNVLALARMLGHKDPSVTLRVYADLFDSDLDAVATTLHAAIRSRMWPKCGHAPTLKAASRVQKPYLPAPMRR